VNGKLAVMVGLGVLAGSAAWAGEPRFEIGGRLGWTFSDGVSGGRVEGADGNLYDRVDLKDSLSYGAQIGFLVTPRWELGFLWDHQNSKAVVGGTRTVEIDDLAVGNYHGYFAFNLRDHGAVRPYVLGGVGATRYGDISFTAGGQERLIKSPSKFSTTWGLGVKADLSRHLGLNLGARWTPTYIWYSPSIRGETSNTRGAGWWCQPGFAELTGPQWGCYTAGEGQFSNQLELSGGVSVRF
jgi:opacity protein-like surface antigen